MIYNAILSFKAGQCNIIEMIYNTILSFSFILRLLVKPEHLWTHKRTNEPKTLIGLKHKLGILFDGRFYGVFTEKNFQIMAENRQRKRINLNMKSYLQS
jgi:hypothetical protein